MKESSQEKWGPSGYHLFQRGKRSSPGVLAKRTVFVLLPTVSFPKGKAAAREVVKHREASLMRGVRDEGGAGGEGVRRCRRPGSQQDVGRFDMRGSASVLEKGG